MKEYTLFIGLLSLLTFSACAKTQILKLMPPEKVSEMMIEEVLETKDFTTQEKVQIIQMKMAEQLERKKKAVETEKDNKLAAIINRPVTPLRTPDTILRVLLLPYEDDNGVLNSWKYSFIKVDDGKWIIADYLNGNRPNTKKTLTPLTDNIK